ncbi:Ribosomal large subunit pseudouridine synthase B [Pediococcus damnosus]|uniref:Pseudouridine synthase n=1 Tax=Pediococcus damnosus TaxID=51663 RepID=A0A0R2HVY8_9LACO|nr:pseudouridine synthase [Pediococcus damnosus]AMV61562.1 Ribosomal large subunit pseudouridine synthase B [Pediococcus damnosus]AMV62074.1 Ribosomal large subunit pseudouridine synthase B [Pediococcus damnosus]AMV65924.1 Ribosomal large subunit pseudouridine synthase B [Pediococcus damnosus]AMV68075.1 Ribosomal large subunit pseudouridine synthase B [Pediococcus damnosus]AMV70260.1 Ribosomal large subunit pseudouridine synthase B [Pediococcus damnosus]
MASERLQKVMAEAGVASRRKSETLITAGNVTVNGKQIKTLGTKVDNDDHIEVNGIPLQREKLVYLLFYKPRGVISSVKDEKKRKTVMSYFPDVQQRIYPVGRLDYDTSGILLMTNDGQLANKLTHPKYKFEKTYVAKVEGIPTNDQMEKLRHGVRIDKKVTAPAKTKVISTDLNKKTAVVEITIHEGRNHQVKKMFDKISHPVIKLKREKYGFLTLDGLQSGEWRSLKLNEVTRLLKR